MLEFLAFLEELNKIVDLFICGKMVMVSALALLIIVYAVDCAKHKTQ